MSSKINIVKIISDHFSTFRDENTRKPAFLDYVVFLILPAVLGIGSYYFGICFPEDQFSVFISALSILAGLLFNILFLIYSLSDSGDDVQKMSKKRIDLRNRFIREVFANISFSIFLAVCGVIVLSVMAFGGFLSPFPTSIVVFIGVMFVFSLFQILKRIHFLLSDKF